MLYVMCVRFLYDWFIVRMVKTYVQKPDQRSEIETTVSDSPVNVIGSNPQTRNWAEGHHHGNGSGNLSAHGSRRSQQKYEPMH